MARLSECERHRENAGNTFDYYYYFARCAHLGLRFVVQINRYGKWPQEEDYPAWVDYVEDLNPEGTDVLVEGHYVRREEPERANELWEWLNERMLAGDGPDSERGS